MNSEKENQEDNSTVTDHINRGVYYYTLRTGVLYFLKIFSVFIMAYLLDPEEFGSFAILNGWIWSMFMFFDLSLDLAVMQKQGKADPSQVDAVAGYALWKGILLMIIGLLASEHIINYHKFGDEELWMFRLMVLTYPIWAVGIFAKVLVDKQLHFHKIAKVEFIETLIMYSSQFLLAYLGYGTWSLVAAFFLRTLYGSLMGMKYHPLKITLKLDIEKIKPLLDFGIPYQQLKVFASIRGMVIPLILGYMMPIKEVGFVIWILNLARMPDLIVNSYERITFPLFSHFQKKPKFYAYLASRSICLMLIILFFIYSMMLTGLEDLIKFGFSAKWEPVIPLVPWAIISVVLHKSRTLLDPVLTAQGLPRVRLNVEIVNTILDVSLCWYAAVTWGTKGYFGGLIASQGVTLFFMFYLCKKYLNSSVAYRFLITTIAMSVSFLICSFINFTVPVLSLFINLSLTFTIYVLITFFADSTSKIDYEKLFGFLETGLKKILPKRVIQ